jgi:MFS family permease
MASDQPPPPPSRLRLILRSLQHRNFRLFFIGQGISLIGTWMQQLAMSWLVYRITGQDAFKMSLVTFATQIPSFLLVPFVGVLLDRWNRHRVVITTQTLALVQAGLLAGLAFAQVIEFWHLIVLSTFLGCINAFDMPARQAFLPEMVDKPDDLANAIALNSSLFNGARLFGPMVAGGLIYLVGEAWCFLINALSYVAVIAALLAMIIPRRPREHHPSHVLKGLKEGFAYAFGFAPIRTIILLIAVLSFVGMPYTVLMPVFAVQVLKGDAATLGLLMTASGVGALTGAIYMASRPSVRGLGSRIVLASLLFGVAVMVFSQSVNIWLSLGVLLLTGFGMMITMAGCNTILQTIVEDDKRGRVMSLYTTAFMGISPFGSLLAGGLANWITAPTTVLICGAACLLGAIVFAWQLGPLRAKVRPIYIEKGILPTPMVPAGEAVPEILVSPEE